ncbi:hypothetical protein KEM63_12245 [Halopseudomonas nanhaiensis]|nr:hypothetical protein KEM63_12245 [Halopseudomonas nanhaiensis]
MHMTKTDDSSFQTKSKKLNQHCVCATLDRPRVLLNLADLLGDAQEQLVSSPTWHQFFSDVAVFVPERDLDCMMETVQALETAAALPGFRQKVLGRAPQTAQINPGPVGAFMGYDFHLSEDGPRLIEVNTNAGGAFLNATLARAQLQCCSGAARIAWSDDFDRQVISQFESEWLLQHGNGKPRRIAIVDDQPTEQYLYPEFRLAQQLFRNAGIDALIVSPSELRSSARALYHNDNKIDLVYNRLVDFSLQAPEHAVLRSAWLDGSAVITPNPFTHALFADKRNLIEWSDFDSLQEWGLSGENIELLRRGVPRTVSVNASNEAELWQQRKNWFFKPVAGYGSKGAYRGSKLTKNTYAQILDSDYIAQTFVPPSERVVMVDGERQMLKVDVRLYTYRGNLILAAARLYQGQTTNFRTPGGGFAPILISAS